MEIDTMRRLITTWRDDPGGTYRTWFLWEERLKNFRSIRVGLGAVVREISDGSFGTVYKGSSLETVVGSIAEQRQIFKGADHAFLWKPKLRIPDIYESPANQQAFGRFLDTCCCCSTEGDVLRAIHALDRQGVKGLGPAAANLLYFLHPTVIPPFNTAIVRGYNTVTGSKVKLGRWTEYLAMREGVLRMNGEHRGLLSNDLGAIGGLLFDIGSGRYSMPPDARDARAIAAWEADLLKIREDAATERLRTTPGNGDRSHTQIQAWLRDLGHAFGFRVHVAVNDRGRPWEAGCLGDGCLDQLPEAVAARPGIDAVRLIDVLWVDGKGEVAAGFEVEHSTSIYSGIVRLLDLALGGGPTGELYLVAPDAREDEVRNQVRRPAFRHISELQVRFLPYSELELHRESMARFGSGLKAVRAAARLVS
jgi:type II restriction enzyme